MKNKLQNFWKSTRKLWLSKFTIVGVCFVLWVMIFGKYNFTTQQSLSSTIEKLENEKEKYKEKIIETRKQLVDIDLHKEKYARERYYMHKPNEEIIVINPEEK